VSWSASRLAYENRRTSSFCFDASVSRASASADGDALRVPLNFPSAGISAANASFAARHEASDG
jgi:hypothetical protein